MLHVTALSNLCSHSQCIWCPCAAMHLAALLPIDNTARRTIRVLHLQCTAEGQPIREVLCCTLGPLDNPTKKSQKD